MSNQIRPGSMIEYHCPKTEARHAGVLAKVGRINAMVVPLSSGKVAITTVPVERIIHELSMNKASIMRWTTALLRQGRDYGITKGARKAITTARREANK